MNISKKGCARVFAIVGLVFAGLCLALAAVLTLNEIRYPAQSAASDWLTSLDKARLAEAIHLRQTLGDQVLPGWADADLSQVLYNEEFLFLTGCPDPAPGWLTVPQGQRLGQAWEQVPGDDFLGQPYYRQRIPPSGQTTQAFTVQVGDCWAASLATYDWMLSSLGEAVKRDIPEFLRPAVPSRLVSRLLVPGSDAYVSTVLHEALHAYQGIRAPDRLAAAERSFARNEGQYPYEDNEFWEAWQVELDLLNEALRAESVDEVQRLARAFLDQRALRREAVGLSTSLIDMERQREWEEGLAKYGERMIYLLASQTSGYQPLPALEQDPEFKGYRGAQAKWDQEVSQIKRMAGADGDVRFYYTGFAQAVLLDRLAPGWQDRIFDRETWLEDLLAEALQ